MKDRSAVSFSKDSNVFYRAGQEDLPTLLVGLMCHSQAVADGVLEFDVLTMPRAMLLVPYRPARVVVSIAEPRAMEILEKAGIEVAATTVGDCVDESEDSAIVDFCTASESPTAFRDRLRMHLLAAIQKQGKVGADWLNASPETCLGGGGGGT